MKRCVQEKARDAVRVEQALPLQLRAALSLVGTMEKDAEQQDLRPLLGFSQSPMASALLSHDSDEQTEVWRGKAAVSKEQGAKEPPRFPCLFLRAREQWGEGFLLLTGTAGQTWVRFLSGRGPGRLASLVPGTHVGEGSCFLCQGSSVRPRPRPSPRRLPRKGRVSGRRRSERGSATSI